MKRSSWKYLAAACVALPAACGDQPIGLGTDPELLEMRRARNRWLSQNADDYRMTVRRQGGMIGGAAVITVRDGVPVSVEGIAPYEGMPASYMEAFDTVDDLFHIVVVAFDNRAGRIDALYHPQLGMPVNVYIDPERNTADEEHGFVVESFEILR